MTDGGDDADTEATGGDGSGNRRGRLRDGSDGDGAGSKGTEPSGVEPESNRGESGGQESGNTGAENGGAFRAESGGEGDTGGVRSRHDGAGRQTEEIQTYTTDRRSLAPRVQLQWAIRTTIGTVVLGSLLTVGLINLNVDRLVGPVVVVVLIGLGLVWVVLRYRVWVYQIRADAIYLERGVVTHVRTLVPYVRIQHVDTSRGPLERALGLSTLVVYTAGSRGADVSIPGLRPEQARDLQQRVKELAIEADGGDAL